MYVRGIRKLLTNFTFSINLYNFYICLRFSKEQFTGTLIVTLTLNLERRPSAMTPAFMEGGIWSKPGCRL
jgi:hypothetical protein